MNSLRLLWVLALLSMSSQAAAHPLSPAALILREREPDQYQLELRHPVRSSAAVALRLPPACTAGPQRRRVVQDELITEGTLRCAGGLPGQRLQLTGLSQALGALVQVHYQSGESARALLSQARPSFVVPARSAWWDVLLAYARLGAEHMLAGLDHLAFVTGLLLVARMPRALLLLTMFTLGHSVTLAQVALLDLALPRAWVELGIALSLLGLALHVLSRGAAAEQESSLWRAALLTFAVGLLHGLGFADGLRALELPGHARITSLLGFNLGIELAQLAVVLALLPLGRLGAWLLARHISRARRSVGYALGALAAMWCIERALELEPLAARLRAQPLLTIHTPTSTSREPSSWTAVSGSSSTR